MGKTLRTNPKKTTTGEHCANLRLEVKARQSAEVLLDSMEESRIKKGAFVKIHNGDSVKAVQTKLSKKGLKTPGKAPDRPIKRALESIPRRLSKDAFLTIFLTVNFDGFFDDILMIF